MDDTDNKMLVLLVIYVLSFLLILAALPPIPIVIKLIIAVFGAGLVLGLCVKLL